MGDYERSTAATTLAALPAPILAAIRAKAEAEQLTLADDASAFLTHSRRRRRSGLLARVTGSGDPDPEHQTALVIGARDVLVCTSGVKRGTTALTARLEDAGVSALSALGAAATKAQDDGMSVSGFPVSTGGVTGRGSLWVGLGAPDGEAARAALADAIRRAKSA